MLKTRKQKLFVLPSVAGLVAVMLVLMRVVMGDVNPVTPKGSSADVPRVEHASNMPHANREDALIVVVQKDSCIYFRGEKIDRSSLPNKIREGVAAGSERKVYIRADARAKAGAVNEVVDAVRAAGIQEIAFLAEDKKPVAPPVSKQ